MRQRYYFMKNTRIVYFPSSNNRKNEVYISMKKQSFSVVGKSEARIDFADKVHGKAMYTNDLTATHMLHGKIHTSTQAHANIVSIDTTGAWETPGVHAVITGEDFPTPVGPMLADRPPLALHKVRYYGEPVALVVADSEYIAKQAAAKIVTTYESLPVVQSPMEAFAQDAPLIHEKLGQYKVQVEGVHAVPHTNIANHTKIRKGNMKNGWKNSDVIIDEKLSFSPADHAALEPRVARAEIKADGKVEIYASTQGPFYIQKLLSQSFNIEPGMISVKAPLVGGAFGGKGTVQLEFLAYLASRAVGGTMVKIVNSREEDLITSPVHIGLEAHVKLGASKDGKLQAASYTFWFDSGAYSDMGAGMSKAGAVDCTGPYKIDHVTCDSYCMYTNHPYATSFRGFGHNELTFVMERAMDILAEKLAIDPATLRLNNAIKPGDTTPTQTHLNASNIGDVSACIRRLKELIAWEDGSETITPEGNIRTKGMSAFWKTSSTPPNATAGVILIFNPDGSVHLSCGAVELGQGTKTVLAQILAERLQMNMKDIHVSLEVDTSYDPHQWKTVASSTTYIAGRAVIAAADDVLHQLHQIGSQILKCSPDDLSVANGKIFITDSPEYFLFVKDVANAYKYPNGNSVGGLVIGKGSHVVRHLTPIDPETGFGKPGPQWTVGAQAVEVEFNPQTCTYTIVQAATVLDIGKAMNPKAAISQMRGGMYMGLSWASRETFLFDQHGRVLNDQLRTYDTIRFSEAPTYVVDFIETPLKDGPYGARGIGEYGVIGMAGALANSLSKAAKTPLNELPLTPEFIWKKSQGGNR